MAVKRICMILLTTVALVFSSAGLGMPQEKFPIRPIQLISSWAPGGGSTINAQALQPNFEKSIGGSIQIENKPGGGGTIGWNYIADSPADGYTVGIVNPSTVVTYYTSKTGVSLDRFDPLALTAIIPSGIVVREDSPWKTFKDLIVYAKNNPGKVQMANSGYAAMYHIGTVGIEMKRGVKFIHVPFKGTGPCISALLGGHVDGSLNEISTLLPYVESKKFRILAISSTTRNKLLPDVPTFRECGFDMDIATWYAYVGPKGIPKDRIKKLQDAFKASVESKAFRTIYEKNGGEATFKTGDDLTAFFKHQYQLWKEIIDFGGFKKQ